MRDPYSVLGVKRNANADEIKSAWRTKAKSIHPDHNQDDPSAGNRFAEVGQAYELLKDPDRRKRYDRAADMNQTINQQRESARQAAERAKMAQANAEKVMEELARANAERAQAQAQAQTQSEPQAQPKNQAQAKAQAKSQPKAQTKTQAGPAGETADDMIERIFGIGPDEREQENAQQQDSSASASTATGSAGESASHPDAAADLKPTLPLLAVDLIAGLVRRIRGTAPAPEKAPDLSVDATVTISDLLKQAWVTVHLADERDVRFPLERGATDGHVMRLKAQGLKLPNMKQGDLVVTLKAAKDANFRIEGFDIHTVLPISLEDAVLGTDVTVETPEGPRNVTIAAWSGSDRVIRIEGLGLSDETGKRGDLVAELRILLWEKPDPKVTDLMRHMRHGLYL